MAEESKSKNKKKKIDSGSISLQIAGDMLLARPSDRSVAPLFKRYEALLEALANMDRDERLINYQFLIGLALTSHAKKTTNIEERKKLFDLKNDLFLNLVNDKANRRKLAFRYLVSKNFRVVEFCKSCEAENTKKELPRFQWRFCKDCKVDRKFYNVLSMHHKFDSGSATMFLSNDMMDKIENFKITQKGKLTDFTEEARFKNYHYNVRNMDVFDLGSVRKAYEKLTATTAK